MPKSPRNLVIATVGDDSRHGSWLAGRGERQFDLALIYYGNRRGAYREHAEFYWERKGFKYSLIDGALDDLGQQMESYDYIWAPDDDIAASTDGINRLFEILRDYQLTIAQPAIGEGDLFYRLLRQQPGLLLRYTQFVEIM